MTLLSILQVLQLGVFVAVAVVSVEQWRRHRGEAAGWVATTLLILLGLAAAGHAIGPGDSGAAVGAARRVVVALLAVFPFSLYRFTASFSPDERRARRLALAGSAVMAATAFVLPAVSRPGGPWPWWLTLYGIGMVGLALVNRFRLVPSLRQATHAPLGALYRSVAAEQALGLAILAVVAVLGTWEPAIHLIVKMR